MYLGIYAYNNPTPYATAGLGCYVVKDATASTAQIEPNTDPVNVQARWNIWFLFTFWTNTLGIVWGLAVSFLFSSRERFILISLIWTGCLYCLAMMAVTVLGSIWRFDNAGKICAGDGLDISSDTDAEVAANNYGTMYSSGRFIKIYLIIIYCFYGLSYLCFLYVNVCKRR